jgi:hypothetical protein
MVKISKYKKKYGRILLSKQDGINKQVGFFFEIFKRAGWKKSENIKQACSSIRDFRALELKKALKI